MKNPILLKANVNKEQALEIMDFLYCEYVRAKVSPSETLILWTFNGKGVATWTNEYKNIMISKDFVDFVSAERDYHLEKFPK